MTGFGQTREGAAGFKERTPFQDKNSILASKPAIGGTRRQMLLKSPDRGSFYNNSAYGGLNSELRQGQPGVQKEIEEEIREGFQDQNQDFIESPDKIGASGSMTDT